MALPLPLLWTLHCDLAIPGARPWERRPFLASLDKARVPLATGTVWRLGEGVSFYPQALFQLKSSNPPGLSHGGDSNQGRKTILDLSPWCLEPIVLEATGREMWGEWEREPGLQLGSIPARAEGKPVSFLHRASLDPGSLGLKSVSLSLGKWETGKDGRKEVSRGKLLPCFLVSLIFVTFSVNTRKLGIACFHANVNC